MNRNFWKRPVFAAGLGLAALTLLARPVPAQGPDGPPMDGPGQPPPFDRPMDGNGPMGNGPMGNGPMGNGPMGGGRGFGGPGQFPMRGPRPVTLATAPLTALVAGLGLKDAQQDKIAQLKQQWRTKRQATMPPDRGGDPFRDAPRPAALQMSSPQALEQQTADGIQSVLTDNQKQFLPALLQTFNALHAAGIPLTIYADLKLTAAQSKQIAALAPAEGAARPSREAGRQAHDKVTALLTDTQKSLVEDARDEMRFLGPGQPPPMPGGRFAGQGRGGPGGFGMMPGGGPQGRQGGGPPPNGGMDGGPGGPPPDGGMNGGMPGGPPPDAY